MARNQYTQRWRQTFQQFLRAGYAQVVASHPGLNNTVLYYLRAAALFGTAAKLHHQRSAVRIYH
jgi:hypothetical protein